MKPPRRLAEPNAHHSYHRCSLLSVCFCDTMAMTFRYLASFNPNGTTYKRPAIPVIFRNGSEEMELTSLVDSGADMSAMDYRPAAKLGLDLSGPKIQSYGVSGPVKSVISHVDLEIGKGHEHYSFRVPVRILFSNTDYYAPTLLGRKGFFEKFKITIDESVQKVVLRAVED